MPIDLKETVVSTGGQFRGTRAPVPDYLVEAIADSVKRGKADAESGVLVVHSKSGRIVRKDLVEGSDHPLPRGDKRNQDK